MTQSTWDDFVAAEQSMSRDVKENPELYAALAGSAADEDSLPSCPWCLASSSGFRENDFSGLVGCGTCAAMIPVAADWYQRGEKVWTMLKNDRC